MCLGVPGQVNVSLIIDAGVTAGDWVLIHLGFAMSKIDEEEARANLAFLAAMGDPFTDEMDALFESRAE